MIVYGDNTRTWSRSAFLALTDPTSRLIAAGEAAQALADAAGSHFPELDALLLHGDTNNLPESIEVKEPEGYAFYAVYPELYASAAAAVRHLAASWTVVGIRSIGTSLGTAVAAALPDARFVTVRPIGIRLRASCIRRRTKSTCSCSRPARTRSSMKARDSPAAPLPPS